MAASVTSAPVSSQLLIPRDLFLKSHEPVVRQEIAESAEWFPMPVVDLIIRYVMSEKDCFGAEEWLDRVGVEVSYAPLDPYKFYREFWFCQDSIDSNKKVCETHELPVFCPGRVTRISSGVLYHRYIVEELEARQPISFFPTIVRIIIADYTVAKTEFLIRTEKNYDRVPYSLDLLIELMKHPEKGCASTFSSKLGDEEQETLLEDTATKVNAGSWLSLRKTFLWEGGSYAYQISQLKEFGYNEPSLLDAATAIFINCVLIRKPSPENRSNEQGNSTITCLVTRCKDRVLSYDSEGNAQCHQVGMAFLNHASEHSCVISNYREDGPCAIGIIALKELRA